MPNPDRQIFDARKNCLNTIRLIAAISVMYIHAIVHLEVDMPAILSSVIAFFQGVPIFFAMSGFLVWESVGRSENIVAYAKKRFLRIYPELWCAVLLGLGAIGASVLDTGLFAGLWLRYAQRRIVDHRDYSAILYCDLVSV